VVVPARTIAPAPAQASFGAQLRHWRQQRGLSQMALALQAEVSTRHISWLETGRAQPSRAMVLRLAQQLDLPLRQRNLWLLAAGFAALYPDKTFADPLSASTRAAVQRLLDAHEPWPALALDARWCLVASNAVVPLLLAGVAPALLQPPVNVLRLSLHPQGLAPMIGNFAAWHEYLLGRLQRQVQSSHDTYLHSLWEELKALPAAPPLQHTNGESQPTEPGAISEVAAPLSLHSPLGTLRFLTTLTVFSAPHDVALSELAIETLLPADEATASALRQLKTQGAPQPAPAAPD
jgi:transcriptional regulator with XRE-family HTH domain